MFCFFYSCVLCIVSLLFWIITKVLLLPLSSGALGPNTKLEERIKDLEKNAERAWKGEQIPKEDIITPGKSRFDESAMIHDLMYKHASKTGKSGKDVRKMKHKADLHHIRSNINHALDSNNKSSLDKIQHISSIPLFLIKIIGETAYGKITGNGIEIN